MKWIDIPCALALAPLYSTPEPNTTIQLYSGAITLEQSGHKDTYQGEISLQMQRVPRVFFRVIDAEKDGLYLDQDRVILSVKGTAAKAKATVLTFQTSDATGNVFSGVVNEPIRVKPRRKVRAVLAHLANFREVTGSWIEAETNRTMRKWRGRVTLSGDDWRIYIDGIDQSKLGSKLPKSGGYGITHALRIERSDGQLFDESDLEQVLVELRYFLSFVRGLWIEPFLFAGLSKNCKVLWETWNQPRIDGWRPVSPWFDGSIGSDLEDFWPAFREMLNNPDWGPALKRAMHWYLAANKREGGVEGAIVLAQTAHELLSWTRFVTEGGLTESFERIPADDKLRLMLGVVSLPLEIPAQLKKLAAVAKVGGKRDGPKAITELRNSIVHPKPKSWTPEKMGTDCIEQAYSLTMWYLDLTLLYIFKYGGQYSNRLVQPQYFGKTERVPWAT